MKHVSEHYFDYQFFEAMLDDTMTYTCGIWNKTTKTLREATINKIEILMKKMRLDEMRSAETWKEKRVPNILDIGSGWGYLVNYIANSTIANVTGITIAPDQNDYAVKRFGHLPRSNFRLFDFRDVVAGYGPGYFDRIVSVGVISHIHIKRLAQWMQVAYAALRPGGLFVMQGIIGTQAWNNALPGRHWSTKDKACRGYNYISKFIFPGGCLLLSDWIYDEAIRAGFVSLQREMFGQHYSRTLRVWRDNMVANKSHIPAHHDETVFLAYEMYLAHCEASYRVGIIDKAHFVFYKPLVDNIHTKPFSKYSNEVTHVWQP